MSLSEDDSLAAVVRVPLESSLEQELDAPPPPPIATAGITGINPPSEEPFEDERDETADGADDQDE